MKTRLFLLAALALLLAGSAGTMHAQDKDKKIILADDFESGNFDKWDRDGEIDPKKIAYTTDTKHVHSGKRAVVITAAVGEGTGSKLVKWFMPGHDKVHARWYCKFAEDFDQGNHMHFVHMLANRADNKWSAFGKAGIKPNGDDFFTTGLEPDRNWGKNPPPGEMFFYSYFPDMKIDPKMNKYWGNAFRPEKKFLIERGRWYCMEMMVKANSEGKKDGEQAFWIDGRLIGHFKDMSWRTTDKLRINCFWLLLYVHDSKKVNKVYFDDVVISTDYIGPVPKRIQGSWGASVSGVKARLLTDSEKVVPGEKLVLSLELENTSKKSVSLSPGSQIVVRFEKPGQDPVDYWVYPKNKEPLEIEPKGAVDLSVEEGWVNPEIASEKGEGKVALDKGSWKVSAHIIPSPGAVEGDVIGRLVKTGTLKLKVEEAKEKDTGK